jgi:hypothetical protein
VSGERRRWPYFPGQKLLLFAAVGIFLGTSLPWARVLGESLWGSPNALTWTISAGCAALAGAMVPFRTFMFASAAFGGVVAVVFAVWQTARIIDRCPLSLDCLPGPGLGFLLVGGLVALYPVARLLLSVPSRD